MKRVGLIIENTPKKEVKVLVQDKKTNNKGKKEEIKPDGEE